MQLTNILRDVREDLGNGPRLPARGRTSSGSAVSDPVTGAADAAAALVRFEAARDREWFARGLPLLPLLDRRSAPASAP